MEGVTALAAGVAVGLPAYEGLREYGPVNLWMHFFSKCPIVIKSSLFSDENKDLFGIRVFFDRTNKQSGEARLPLSRIRDLAASRIPAATFKAECQYSDGNVASHNILAIIIEGHLILKEDDQEGAPFWLKMEDVQRVL